MNAVDIVTQWEIVAACERISEAFLLPVLEGLVAQFPFRILGLHSDNGSEYINKVVASSLSDFFLNPWVIWCFRESLSGRA